MNIHMINGRLVRDPEFSRGSEPTKDRCKFTIAVDRKYGDETDFFECTTFGKLAEIVSKYAKKGTEVVLAGEGQIRSYDDKNGIRRKSYSIVVRDFRMCGSRSDSSAPSQADPEPQFEEVEEDIPF